MIEKVAEAIKDLIIGSSVSVEGKRVQGTHIVDSGS
jgi:hypothetical protein